MGLLIDSSAIIAAERGKLDLNQLLAVHGSQPIVISVKRHPNYCMEYIAPGSWAARHGKRSWKKCYPRFP
jgi:hypothetical protein